MIGGGGTPSRRKAVPLHAVLLTLAGLPLLGWASPGHAQITAEQAIANHAAATRPACRGARQPDDILVCGRRGADDRYRLPFPEEGRVRSGSSARGEAPRATIEPVPIGPCGMSQGQRRGCTRAEMEESGFYRGRDPVTVLGNIARGLVDPD